MSEEKKLAIRSYSLDKPAEMIEMANELKGFIVKQKLFSNINGKNYAQVDGWQFAGFLTGLTPIVREIENQSTEKEIKYSAKVYLKDQAGNVVSVGYAICSNLEPTKKGFAEYAILSMAQTRAIGKAFRNKLGWVMKLAGYESTPKEEMDNEVKKKEAKKENKVVASELKVENDPNELLKKAVELKFNKDKK